jgi:signal transduction histidine kinase
VALRFANQALETSSHAVESGAQMRGELLMNVSHEIFTTMTSILGFAERLLVEPGLEKAPLKRVESLKTIARNSRRLLGIIDNVIDLSRLEARKLEVESVACSPASILTEVVFLMRGRAAAKGLSLTLDYDGPFPESIYTDPKRFRQILVNLVGNAIQFTEAGEVRIIARLLGRDGGMPRVACTVVDTGVGMPPERIAKLFEPLHRRNTTKRRKLTHPGLGLVVSKMLANLLDGDITVESTPGKGSSFTVAIATGPLGKARMMDDPSQAAARCRA